MRAATDTHTLIVRTERGLTISGSRITLYDVMDYLTAEWPPHLIRDRLNLTSEQIEAALAYIETHRPEVEAEYQAVLQTAEDNREYWAERNRERFARIASSPPRPDQAALREKLAAWKAKQAAE